jgi:hypothetical protein
MMLQLTTTVVLFATLGLSQAQNPLTCQTGEALFTVNAYSGDSYHVYWRLEDNKNGSDLMGCDSISGNRTCLSSRGEDYNSTMCLRADGCYRLILGDQFWTYPDDIKPYFNATFNGDQVAAWTSFRFKAIDFGGACSPSCSQDQSLFEFFTFRRSGGDVHYPELSWELQSSKGETLVNGAEDSQDSRLLYVRECVPSGICMTFNLSVPETSVVVVPGKPDRPYFEDSEYRIQLDSVIFADKNYKFGYFDLFKPPVFEETTALGICTVQDICDDPKNEALLDVQLTTPAIIDGSTHRINWNVAYSNETKHIMNDRVVDGSNYFSGYLSNSTFRVYSCVPNNDCMEVYVIPRTTVDSSLVNYKCLWNGKVIIDDTMCDASAATCSMEGGEYEYYIGRGCPTKLSGGGIAGIVVGVLAFLVVAVGCYKLQHRRKQRTKTAHIDASAPPKEENPIVDPSKIDRVDEGEVTHNIGDEVEA